jgi:predicted AAA+ superfamily ATPase
MDESELFAIAERWAVSKGGRSPRRAKQIVDLIYSALSRGEEIDF